MAGIYLHIPFCKQACHYCDFHFSTNRSKQADLVNALLTELDLRHETLKDQLVETIYFGGGTPSLLTTPELGALITKIKNNFKVSNQAEITLEANPDDLNEQMLREFHDLGVNRLSIGIQTFHDELLTFLNRAHTSKEAKNCVQIAQKVGINNISIDLIYGIHGSNNDSFQKDIDLALQLGVPHISAYCLTIEEKTAFGKWNKAGKLKEVEDIVAINQYEILIKELGAANYEQYEISNFARDKHYSKHNSNYWKQKNYLGVGPGAHSFNGSQRSYNISNNAKYINSLEKKSLPIEIETLSTIDRVNEYFLTTLRTKWGVDLLYLKEELGFDLTPTQLDYFDNIKNKDWIDIVKNRITLTDKGKLFADEITLQLFISSDE